MSKWHRFRLKLLPTLLAYLRGRLRGRRSLRLYQQMLFPSLLKVTPSIDLQLILLTEYNAQRSFVFTEHSYIDNHNLQLLREDSPFSTEFLQFATHLNNGEDLHHSLITLNSQQEVVRIRFKPMRQQLLVKSEQKILSFNTHGNILFIFTQGKCSVIQIIEKGGQQITKLSLGQSKISCQQGFSNNGFIVVYAEGNSVRWKKWEKVLSVDVVVAEGKLCCNENKVENVMAMPYCGKTLIILSTRWYVAVYSLNSRGDSSLLHRMEDTKWRPKTQRNYFINTLCEGGRKQSSFKEGESDEDLQNRRKLSNIKQKSEGLSGRRINSVSNGGRESHSSSPSFGSPTRESVGLQSEEEGDYRVLLVATIGPTCFFLQLKGEQVVGVKKMGFGSRVQYVGSVGEGGVIIVLQQKSDSSPSKGGKGESSEVRLYLRDALMQNEDLSLLTEKYFSLQLREPCGSCAVLGSQLWIAGEKGLRRVRLSDWKDIYNDMVETEQLQLLLFLILLKRVPSPLLNPPSLFQGLQHFFPCDNGFHHKILLQYYNLVGLPPTRLKWKDCFQLTAPFIINHRIDNLDESVHEELMQYWLQRDERLVQEMVVAGVRCGWQLALNRLWVRGLVTMVAQGLQIQLPFIKLASPLFLPSSLLPSSSIECVPLLSYTRIAFTELARDQQSLKPLIKALLTIWPNLLNNCPLQATSLISCIFAAEGRLQMLNQIPTHDFLECRQRIPQLLPSSLFTSLEGLPRQVTPNQGLMRQVTPVTFAQKQYAFIHSNSPIEEVQGRMIPHWTQMSVPTTPSTIPSSATFYPYTTAERILSELSATLLLRIEHRNTLKEALLKQHCKLMWNSFKLHEEGFWFQCNYLEDMLSALMQDQTLREVCGSPNSQEEEFISLQFLNYLWSLIQERDRQQIQVRSLLAKLQTLNSQHGYLFATIMRWLPQETQDHRPRILRLLLNVSNKLAAQSVFEWLEEELGGMQQQDDIFKIIAGTLAQAVFNHKDNEQTSPLHDEVIRCLRQLFQLSKERTRELLEKYYGHKRAEIVHRIDNDPALQLAYVETVLRQADTPLAQEFQTLHVRLLLQLRPHSLLQVLSHPSAPYDAKQVLQMVTASPPFEHKHALLALLYEREGEIQLSIGTFLDAIEYYFAQLQQLDEDEPIHNRSVLMKIPRELRDQQWTEKQTVAGQRIETHFNSLRQLLNRQPCLRRNFMEMCFDRLALLLKTGGEGLPSSTATYLLGTLLVEFNKSGTMQTVAEWLANTRVRFDLAPLRHYFSKSFYNVSTHLRVLKKATALDCQYILKQLAESISLLNKPASSNSQCALCERVLCPIQSQEGLLFTCGHLYHRYCLQKIDGQYTCWKCVEKYPYEAILADSSLHLVDVMNRLSRRNNKQIQIKESTPPMIDVMRRRNNRLAYYERRASTLAQQIVILEAKITLAEAVSHPRI